MYIDCKTPKKKRNDIINKYKDGKIPFLVNVRILVEGFDAPITKGVCFLHLPNNKTTLIQIIGRCLRLHPNKTIANIILPFSSKEDEKNIGNFLKVMAKNDTRIKKSFENKQLGGYISIDITEETDDEDINDSIEFKYNIVYDSMGMLTNADEIWMKRLEEVKKYIDDNNKRPNQIDKTKDIQKLGWWIGHQVQNYKNKNDIMKKSEIYNKWTEFITCEKYRKYFMSNEEQWLINFNIIKKYIDENNKIPVQYGEDITIMGKWLSYQKAIYKKKEKVMRDVELYNKWTEFITSVKYKKYFMSNEEQWLINLTNLKKYIDENNKRPSHNDKIEEIKTLGNWMTCQNTRYENEEKVMKNSEIYNKWTEFITSEKYKKYFLSNEEEWLINLNNLKKYIDENNKTPSQIAKNKVYANLGIWLSTQKINYKSKEKIMKNPEIYNKWTEIIISEKYKKYFLSNEDEWLNNLDNVKKYIDENDKRPSTNDKKNEIQIFGKWIIRQNNIYKLKEQIMKNPEIYNKWTEFITFEKYKKYFLSNEDEWLINLNDLKKYIDKNNKRPSI